MIVRHAQRPGQTLNIDLCFVPATHAVRETLPMVSGSSGQLTVTAKDTVLGERTWPGQVFETPDISYEAAMPMWRRVGRK